MYNLNNFCNVITHGRRAKQWSQSHLAKVLGVSPQSVSKWECGVGFPDVTLFPKIAEALDLPIGALFGEESDVKFAQRNEAGSNEYIAEFEKCHNIDVRLGNTCRVEFIDTEDEFCRVVAKGDPVFIRYFDVEPEDDRLLINIKNPLGSDVHWKPYDREGYGYVNTLHVYTGYSKDVDVNRCTFNFLDLHTVAFNNVNGNFEVICYARP